MYGRGRGSSSTRGRGSGLRSDGHGAGGGGIMSRLGQSKRNNEQYDDNPNYGDGRNYDNRPYADGRRGGFQGRGAGRGAGRGRGTSAFSRQTSRSYQQPGRFSVENNMVAVGIQGWEGGDQVSLMEFLKRHADGEVVFIGTSNIDGDTLIVRVENIPMALRLSKLSGIRFAGGKLRIFAPSAAETPLPSGVSKAEVLTSILLSRYNPEQRLLALDGFMDDPMVRRLGLGDLNPQLGDILVKAIASACPDVQSLSLARLNLNSTLPFSTLWQHIPNLVNLSLQDNNISSLRDLEPISGKNFRLLQELIVKGNPVETRECNKPGGEPRFRSIVKSLFPTIQMLDFEPILEEISFDINETAAKDLPVQVQQHFLENQDVSNAAYQFLNQYFTTFDSARPALINFYDPAAFCTIQVNTVQPPWARQARRVDFGPWLEFNRNHVKRTREDARESVLLAGREQIVGALTRLPNVTHPLTENNGQAFAIDAWVVQDFSAPGGDRKPLMLINVVGEFYPSTERQRTSYSFVRTFLITPSPPGSDAINNGVPFVIVNDEWTVKVWGGQRRPWLQHQLGKRDQSDMDMTNAPNEMMQSPTTTGGMSPAMGMSPAVQQLRLSNGINDMQHAQILQFAQVTGLNYKYSWQCLAEHNWDGQRGLEGFQLVKDRVPPDAYTPI